MIWRAALALAGAALLWPAWPALLVAADGDAAAVLPLAGGGRFGLRFVHSVDRAPVEDWYRLDGTAVVQDATRLLSFGAGMGHLRGASREDGPWLHITEIDRPIGVLRLRVGPPAVVHTLIAGDRRWVLSACWPGRSVTIRGVRVPLASLLAASATRRLPACEGPQGP